MTTQTVLAHPTAGAFLRVRRHGDWVTIEADWGIGGIGFPDNPASYPPPAEWERRRQEVSELVQHATDRCFLLGYRGRQLFFSGSSTSWCVTAPREDELLLLTALLTAAVGDFRAAHAYLALPGRGHGRRNPAPDSPPADPPTQPAEPTAPDSPSGARVVGRGLPPLFLAALRRSVRRDHQPGPQQRAAAALRRSREQRRREGR